VVFREQHVARLCTLANPFLVWHSLGPLVTKLPSKSSDVPPGFPQSGREHKLPEGPIQEKADLIPVTLSAISATEAPDAPSRNLRPPPPLVLQLGRG
jgi:hypothetical protein